MIGRRRDYSDDVWRFLTQPKVPFTNNLLVQAVHMSKVKQKVLGCFRTLRGTQTFWHPLVLRHHAQASIQHLGLSCRHLQGRTAAAPLGLNPVHPRKAGLSS